ncbi:MAG TPA: glycosyltransferase [Clostridiales bacterium]|nr:glycosyltransferase [Clostridiales bacterium]
MSDGVKKISLVIPCYGSEKTVRGVIGEIQSIFLGKVGYDYEVVAVNDCSPDNVIEVLEDCAAADPKVKVVDLAMNRGKHIALLCGFSYVTGDIVVTVDDDGQCPLDRLWDLIAPVEGEYDQAMASYGRRPVSGMKRFGSNVNNMMSRWLLDKPSDLKFSNFIARKRFVTDAMANYNMPFAYLEGISLTTTRKIKMVEMQERDRAAGKSGYTFSKSLKLWLNGYTAFSSKPLRIGGYLGMVLALAGFLGAVIDLIRLAAGSSFDFSFWFITALMTFLTGVILMCMGLLGEYVGRIFVAQNNANQYVVRKTCNIEK